MDQNLLQAFGLDKLRFQDVFVCASFLTAVLLFRAPDSYVLQASWRLDINVTTDYGRGFLPLPVITDLDGDGINEIVIVTREPGVKILTLPNWGSHKSSTLPHLHTKAETVLHSNNELKTSSSENEQSPSLPVAMTTGCLHESSSAVTTCQQVIVVMSDDTTVHCYSHQLKLLWRSRLIEDKLPSKIYYKEVSILVDYESVKGGLVIVGGRLGADISLAREHRHEQMLNHPSIPPVEKIVNELPNLQVPGDSKGEPSKLEEHFSTYALSGLSGRVKWRHEPGDFENNQTSKEFLRVAAAIHSNCFLVADWSESKELMQDDLFSYHYKLALHSSKYHVGEVHWSHYSAALVDAIPHRVGHPSYVRMRAAHFVKNSHRTKAALQDVRRPNTVVIYNERGIEVLDIATGRPVCNFPSPKSTATLADINQDGAIDQIESRFYAHPAQQSEETVPHCSGVASTGSKVLFVGPICHSPSVFEYVGQSREFHPEEYGEEPLQLPPVVVESPPHRSGIFTHLMGRTVQRQSDGYDIIFFLSSGKVTSFGSYGEFNWQVDSEASWRSYIAGDKYHRGDVSSYVEERFVPDMQAVKHTTTQQRPESVLVVGWNHLALVSLGKGETTSIHSLPCQPISPVVQGDFSNDGVTDFIIHCRTSYLGFVLQRNPGYWWTAVWVASGLGIVLTAVFFLRVIEEEISGASSP